MAKDVLQQFIQAIGGAPLEIEQHRNRIKFRNKFMEVNDHEQKSECRLRIYYCRLRRWRWDFGREAGRSWKEVLVLEAGGDPKKLQGGNAIDPKGNRMPQDYDVPVFHALSTENEAIRWNYFVRHYADDVVQKKDTKYVEEYPLGSGKKVDGILYPRQDA